MIEPLDRPIANVTNMDTLIYAYYEKINELVKEINELKKTPSMPNESL